MNDDIAVVPERPPKKRGRTPSRVWKMISSRGDDEMECTVCNCCFCEGVVSHYGHVDRVVKHLLICLHCPVDVKESLLLQYPNLDPNKPKETKKEENNQPPWTSHQQQEFEVLLSDFIYANNLPFNIVNYDLMKQLIYKLNPQAKLPSSDKLATLLLDASYQRVKDAMMAKINASTSYYTLQNDATEDISEHSIFNFVISNPYESFYLKTLNKTPLSDVITNFTKLEKKIEKMRCFDEAEKTFIKLQIKKRRDFIASEDHKIALLLDPRYKFTDYYSATEETSISNKVKNYYKNAKEFPSDPRKSPEAIVTQRYQFLEYRNNDFREGDPFFDAGDLFHPLLFWKEKSNLWPELGEIAIRIFSGVASSADVERSFSYESIIHTKQRNRLGLKKVEKLLFIKYNYSRVFQLETVANSNANL